MTKSEFYDKIHQELAVKYNTNIHIIKHLCCQAQELVDNKAFIEGIVSRLHKKRRDGWKVKRERSKGLDTKAMFRRKPKKYYEDLLKFLSSLNTKQVENIIKVGTQEYETTHI